MSSCLKRGSSESLAGGVCRVVVFYEEGKTRDFTVRLCGGLLAHFAGDLEFEFSWYRTDLLGDPRLHHEAGTMVQKADLILIATQGIADFSLEVKGWLQRWLQPRTAPDSALALLQPQLPQPLVMNEQDAFLRRLALQANLDYLLLTPETIETTPAAPQPLPQQPEVTPRPIQAPAPDEDHYHSRGWGLDE